MDIASNLLLFIHLVALAVGAATNIAMPLVAGQMARAAPDTRAALGAIARRLSINARVAVAVLVASGIALLQVRYGGTAGQNGWFWAKMALVAVVVVLVVIGAVVPPGRLNPRIFGNLTRVMLLAIVLTAVFAFR